MIISNQQLMLIALLPGLFGCSPMTLQELRSEPPANSGAFQVNYESLAGCVAAGLQGGNRSYAFQDAGDLAYTVIHLAAVKRVTVTGRIADVNIIDLKFQGNTDGTTLVETRWGAAFSGGAMESRRYGQKVDKAAWPILRSCAEEIGGKAPTSNPGSSAAPQTPR